MLILEDSGEIETIPISNFADWSVSPEKVNPVPVSPYTDLISEIPYDVIAVATYPDSKPSKIKDSFFIKVPFVSYKVIKLFDDTDSLINPLAPLFFPWTKVGTSKVIGSFKVISVTVCISKSDTFHSFTFELEVL